MTSRGAESSAKRLRLATITDDRVFYYLLVFEQQNSDIAYSPKDKMVYYFTSNVTSPSAYIYMGKDKVESQH